ncbi:MAG: glycosyltransferase family 2 protein [Deltaproteobacteria bacterium]|nr:glycosyltransferase family 2 protein [Deltaproteobacteria bacterium]
MRDDGLDREEKTPRLGVVIPLANEEATVHDLLQRVLAQLEGSDRVFCILDGTSRDRTMELVRDVASADPRVELVWAPENRCVVDAYFRGYREALAAGCEWILEMDGGMSHCPEEIPKFLEAIGKGIDFAAGSRFIRGGSYRGRWSRWLLSRGGTVLANLLLGTRMKDMTSGFEAFSRRALSFVVANGVRSRAHFFQTEIRYMMHDWPWIEIPISYTNPNVSIGKGPIFESFRILFRLAREARGSGWKEKGL